MRALLNTFLVVLAKSSRNTRSEEVGGLSEYRPLCADLILMAHQSSIILILQALFGHGRFEGYLCSMFIDVSFLWHFSAAFALCFCFGERQIPLAASPKLVREFLEKNYKDDMVAADLIRLTVCSLLEVGFFSFHRLCLWLSLSSIHLLHSFCSFCKVMESGSVEIAVLRRGADLEYLSEENIEELVKTLDAENQAAVAAEAHATQQAWALKLDLTSMTRLVFLLFAFSLLFVRHILNPDPHVFWLILFLTRHFERKPRTETKSDCFSLTSFESTVPIHPTVCSVISQREITRLVSSKIRALCGLCLTANLNNQGKEN